ncbi:hypothetical protein D3C79_665720 [compost metagenome]
MARALRHAMAVRDSLPAGRFLDVRFEDTLAAPLAVVERIYRFAGLECTASVNAAMDQWLAANGREKRATHHYSPEQFGLSDALLQRDYAEYRARHIHA